MYVPFEAVGAVGKVARIGVFAMLHPNLPSKDKE
jgi:hypothetical protein